MKEAVIVSTARTPIGKAYRGAFNNTESPTMGGHTIREAVKRAGIEPEEVDDVIMGVLYNRALLDSISGELRALSPVCRSLCQE